MHIYIYIYIYICTSALDGAHMLSMTRVRAWGIPIILLEGTVLTSLDSKNRERTNNKKQQTTFEEQGICLEEWIDPKGLPEYCGKGDVRQGFYRRFLYSLLDNLTVL